MKNCIVMIASTLFFISSLVANGYAETRAVTLQFNNETGHEDSWLVIRLTYSAKDNKRAMQYDDRVFTSQPFSIDIGPDGYSDLITVVTYPGRAKSVVTLNVNDISATFNVEMRPALKDQVRIKLIRTDKNTKNMHSNNEVPAARP